MNCKKCGAALASDDQFCKNCGAAVEAGAQPAVGATGANVAGAGAAAGTTATSAASNMNTVSTNSFGATGTASGMGAMSTAPANSMMNTAGTGMTAGGFGSTSPMNSTFQPQPAKSNTLKYIIAGIVAVIVIAVGVVIAIIVMNSGDKKKDDGSDKKPGTSITQPASSTHSVKFQGFTMEVPDDFVTEVNGDDLLFADDSGEWLVQLNLLEGSFSNVKANRASFQQNLERNGYQATPAKSQNYDGMEFISSEITAQGQTGIAAFADVYSGYVGALTIVNMDNEADYSLLESMAPILKSMERSSSSNSIKLDFDLNPEDYRDMM